MDEKEKEKFRKQLEAYKKEIGLKSSKLNLKIDKTEQKSIDNKTIDKKNIVKKDLTKSFNFSSEKNKSAKTEDKKPIGKTLDKEILKQTSNTKIKKESDSKTASNKSANNSSESIKKTTKLENKKSSEKIFENKQNTESSKKPIFDTEKQNINKIENPEKKIQKIEKKVIQTEKKTTLESVKKPINTQENTKTKTTIIKEDKKKSKLKYFIIPILLMFLAYGVYYLYNKNKETKIQEQTAKEADLREIALQDSILDYRNSKPIEEPKEKIKVKLSDTIVNIKSQYPDGYYVVIGAYSETKNAKKLQKKNPTIFESYIFDGKIKRVALLVGNKENESKAIENLKIIRFKYPDAWLMYNKLE